MDGAETCRELSSAHLHRGNKNNNNTIKNSTVVVGHVRDETLFIALVFCLWLVGLLLTAWLDQSVKLNVYSRHKLASTRHS